MLTTTMAQAVIARNAAPNVSQSFAQDTRMRAKKESGGPGTTGRMEPARPAMAAIRPRMISVAVKVVPLLYFFVPITCTIISNVF